jgi:importin subunit beta-1
VDPRFTPFVQHIVNFVNFVCSDPNRSDNVTRGAVGVLGDIGQALGAKAKPYLQQPFIKNILDDCQKSENASTRDVAQWAREVSSHYFIPLFFCIHSFFLSNNISD